MSTMYNFTGRVALITGSSSGIGAATAILLAKAGARVVITGRNYQKLAAVYKQCADVSPHKCRPAVQVVADVTNEADMDRLLAITIDTFGKLDILVNNVGFLQSALIDSNDYMKNFRPGSIYTDLLENGFGITGAESRALFDKVAANYPVGRMGEGLDVANAVAYLASDQGSFITGTHLYVDGGHIAANISIEL
ncbi:unnamed protein product [Medioppia subpectinata]|uniref:Uncharacterized protein n=1 Tax=Medioppia subpectinata TaxID=1979941 RepID=A0A7R9L357_9ACAR|nr:unnamed protein product [Medioppia subpectinata]CAG2114425.1 unnamed protein product [Medioppia subpectinata]